SASLSHQTSSVFSLASASSSAIRTATGSRPVDPPPLSGGSSATACYESAPPRARGGEPSFIGRVSRDEVLVSSSRAAAPMSGEHQAVPLALVSRAAALEPKHIGRTGASARSPLRTREYS